MRLLRWIAFAIFLAALAGYQVYAVFIEEPDPSGHLPPAKDVHLSREVSGICALTQTFVVHADGFSGIEVYPRRGISAPYGRIRFRILDGRSETFTPLQSKTFDMATLDLTGALMIPVPRVDDSAGGLFMLEVLTDSPAAGNGSIKFEQGGPTYPEGQLWINCLSDWGDLKLRIEVQRSTIASNLQHLRRSLPAPLRSDGTLLAVLIVGNGALAVVVYGLAFAPDRRSQSKRPNRSNQANPPNQSPKGSVETTAAQPRV